MRETNLHLKMVICCICAITSFGIVRTHALTLPADPNNAALLYYQAFLLHPDVPTRIESQYDDVLRGASPSGEIRRYVRRCREAIAFVEKAVRLPRCDWGIPFSEGLGAQLPQLAEVRRLSCLLRVNAQVLAFDGDYDAALRQSLTIRRFAEHVGHDTLVLHFTSNSVDSTALRSVQDILGVMPPDSQLLKWLRKELAAPAGSFQAYSRAMRMDMEMVIQSLQDTLAGVRDQLVEAVEDDQSREEAKALMDEVLIRRAREPYAAFLDKALQVMNSDRTYAQKHAEIENLGKKLRTEFRRDPIALPLIIACRVEGLGDAEARHHAVFALFQTAVEVYLVAAETGRLPKHLADDWPTDPLTNEEFDYEITKTGFVLRHRNGNIPGGGIRPFEFFIPNPNMLRK